MAVMACSLSLVEIRVIGIWSGFKTSMNPHVLFRLLLNSKFNHSVYPCYIGHVITGWEVFKLGVKSHVVAGVVITSKTGDRNNRAICVFSKEQGASSGTCLLYGK